MAVPALETLKEKVVCDQIFVNPTCLEIAEKFTDFKFLREPISNWLTKTSGPNIRLVKKIDSFLKKFIARLAEHQIVLSEDELVDVSKIALFYYAIGRFPSRKERTDAQTKLLLGNNEKLSPELIRKMEALDTLMMKYRVSLFEPIVVKMLHEGAVSHRDIYIVVSIFWIGLNESDTPQKVTKAI